MLMPSDSVSVANTTRRRLAEKQSSTASRKAGMSPAWCEADARLEPGRPRPVPEDAQLFFGEPLGVLLAPLADLGPLLGAGEPHPVRQALRDGVVARRPGEDEDDGGQHGPVVERLDELAATRASPDGSAASPPGRRARRATRWSRAGGLGMDLALEEQRHELDPPAPLLGDGHVVAQLDRPVLLHDDLGRAPRPLRSHAPNSAALDTVADRHTNTTSGGARMITSSHTDPR